LALRGLVLRIRRQPPKFSEFYVAQQAGLVDESKQIGIGLEKLLRPRFSKTEIQRVDQIENGVSRHQLKRLKRFTAEIRWISHFSI
jgi:hypothetical protein